MKYQGSMPVEGCSAFKCDSIKCTGKVSLPAATGVCVVKTVARLATS